MPRRRHPPPPPDRLAAILGAVGPPAWDEPGDHDLPGDRDLPGHHDRPGDRDRLEGRARTQADPQDESAWQREPSAWVPRRPGDVTKPPVATRAAEHRGGRHRRPSPPGPALFTVPAALRGLAARPSRLAVLGLLLVVVIAALALGVRVAWARAGAAPRPVAAQAADPLEERSVPAGFAGSSGSPTVGATGGPAATGAPTPLPSAATILLVHVVGQVRNPGVVRLTPGARVRDAVREAGGATRKADLSGVNLARPVADGEQVVVPRPGEAPTPLPGAPPAAAAPGAGSAGTPGQAAPLDLNTATAIQLEELPGVGPVLSQRIVDWRTEHGRFSNVDELLEVSGIGDKMLSEIGPQVHV